MVLNHCPVLPTPVLLIMYTLVTEWDLIYAVLLYHNLLAALQVLQGWDLSDIHCTQYGSQKIGTWSNSDSWKMLSGYFHIVHSCSKGQCYTLLVLSGFNIEALETMALRGMGLSASVVLCRLGS